MLALKGLPRGTRPRIACQTGTENRLGMSDHNGDPPLAPDSNENSQFMNGGKLTVSPTGAFFVTPPARFRMALVSLLGGWGRPDRRRDCLRALQPHRAVY